LPAVYFAGGCVLNLTARQ